MAKPKFRVEPDTIPNRHRIYGLETLQQVSGGEKCPPSEAVSILDADIPD
jgi:hypothetical protein